MEKFKDKYAIKDEIVERSFNVTKNFISQVFNDDYSKEISLSSENVTINDMKENLQVLKQQITILKRFGINDFPCFIADESLIPIDIFQLFRSENYYLYDRGFDEKNIFWDDYLYHMFRRDGLSDYRFVKNVGFDSLKSNLEKLIRPFIEIRFASLFDKEIRNDLRSNTKTSTNSTTNNYLTVKINTVNHGLDISASPAYFLSWKKFGNPTSPVTGYLMPATYLFAATGVNVPRFTIDSIPVDIPPNFDINISTF